MNFSEIIKKNKNNVKNIIRLITKEDNEDLEQEVYLKVWKNSHKYKEQGTFSSWVNTIAKNVSKDYLKSRAKRYEQNSTSDETAFAVLKDKKATPELRLVKSERQERIVKEIKALKPKFRQVIVLCEIQGYTYEECAQKLKCPVGTIKSRVYNAKKQLAESLQDLL